MSIATVNPATGEVIEEFAADDAATVDRVLDSAAAAVRALAELGFEERAQRLRAAADLLDAEVDDVAAMITLEMGKTLGSARAEVEKCATALRWFADHAPAMLQPRIDDNPGTAGASAARVEVQPIGAVLAIMPWNFPLWQVIRFAAPALMIGNAGVLKHAPSVPRCSRYLGSLFTRAGFPQGAFADVLIEDNDVVADVIKDRRIAAVTLTGSVAAGASVAATAGSVIKKSVLELGGSDAYVVMPSADLDKAVEVAVTARLQNSGQSCIAAKRFVVHSDVYDEFLRRFTEQMAAARTGDPHDEDVVFGPMSSVRLRDELAAQVDDAREHGATITTGGTVPEGPGAFYPATVITDVTPAMRVYGEECFGPVACVYRVADADEAIALANDTRFGLSSSVWTTDDAERDRFVRDLAAGGVFVNGMTASTAQLPFGGVKDSGYGRELGSWGLYEFANVKTVWQA